MGLKKKKKLKRDPFERKYFSWLVITIRRFNKIFYIDNFILGKKLNVNDIECLLLLTNCFLSFSLAQCKFVAIFKRFYILPKNS